MLISLFITARRIVKSDFKGVTDLIKLNLVVTTDQIARELKTNKSTAAGLLTTLKKMKKIVGENGVWAMNKTNLNNAEYIFNSKKTTIAEMYAAFYAMVKG
jgi:hypothetical protein